MPVFEDWLKSPISIINNLFASDPTNFDQKLHEYFDNKLKLEKNYNLIPCLNDVPIHELSPNSLVRYRCMIQDSFDPIYFSGTQQFRHKGTGEIVTFTLKYKETFEYSDEYEPFNDTDKSSIDLAFSSNSNLQQRVTFYCVPIPGESDWVKKVHMSNNIQGSSSSGTSSNTSHRPSKRGIDSENDFNEKQSLTERPLHDNSNVNKASNTLSEISQIESINREKNQSVTLCNSCFKVKATINENELKSSNNKKSKSDEIGESKSNTNSNNLEFNLNFPLPSNSNDNGVACLVKIYDNFENYKINDIFEFVGVLSQDPSLAYMYDDNVCTITYDQDQKQQEEQIARFSKICLDSNDENSMDTEQANTRTQNMCNCTEQDQANFVKSNSRKVLSNFPPSLVPRLHCLKAYRLLHDNPLLEKNKSVNEKESTKYWKNQYENFLMNLNKESSLNPTIDAVFMEKSYINLSTLRKELVDFFQELLLGDVLAAEYLLMHLISSVFIRRDVTILGKFCLNITNIPQLVASPNLNQENSNSAIVVKSDKDHRNFAFCFYNVLKKFLTKSHMFKMTVDSLNKANMIPNKDYNKDKLITGMLQLPDNFNLIIDETQLNAGALNQKGIFNVNSIRDIIKWQKLNYDFSYHQQEFHTNIKILILSETKSILPFDVQLKLKANIEKFDADKYINFTNELMSKTNPQLVDNMRKYLTILSQIDYKLGETMQKIVEDDIVNIRQNTVDSNANSKEKISVDDLHLLLVVARLQSISYGKSELSVNEWNKAKLLEIERIEKRQ